MITRSHACHAMPYRLNFGIRDMFIHCKGCKMLPEIYQPCKCHSIHNSNRKEKQSLALTLHFLLSYMIFSIPHPLCPLFFGGGCNASKLLQWPHRDQRMHQTDLNLQHVNCNHFSPALVAHLWEPDNSDPPEAPRKIQPNKCWLPETNII